VQNVFEIDAADLDEVDGTIVPKELAEDADDDAIDEDAYEFPRRHRSIKHEWGIKVVNDADQDIDGVPLLTTDDDEAFDEYVEVDPTATTIGQGTAPDNVELFEGDIIANSVGVELTPAAAATGTVKVVFQSRRMG